jgi:cytochrome P450
MERWRGLVRSVVNQLVDEVQDKGRMDVMEDFAVPLPLLVIAQLLGIPERERAFVRDLAKKRMSHTRATPDRMRLAAEGIKEMNAYFTPLVEARLRQPANDLLSLLAVSEKNGTYSRDEVLANTMLLVDAGHETTINLICNGTLALLRHRDQWDLLRRDPSLVAKATEECLRYDPPVKALERITAQDLELRGKRMRSGERVRWAIAAANRDPEAFPDPDRFDITRSPNHHVAFGSGIHYCLGQYLARVEGQEAFQALTQRLPALRLETDRIEYVPSFTLRTVKELPVAWT